MASEIITLTNEEVVAIHEKLAEDFSISKDPISPPGVKSMNMIESAVYRQHVGFDGETKYGTPVKNAATLCYGICSNHAFHNGNKRAALVALLCHLEKNGLVFSGYVKQDDLYRFMKKIADHKFGPKRKNSDTSDLEVEEIANWIQARTRRKKKADRVITYRELKKVLLKFDIVMENPKGNYIDLVKVEIVKEKKRTGLFSSKEIEKEVRTRLMKVPWPGEGKVVGKNIIRSIRKTCSLNDEDGVDSEVFYSDELPLDYFITKYRGTLNRLAKT